MKIGDRVVYWDGDGAGHAAYVVDVGGNGPSGMKILGVDLEDGREFRNVCHHEDRAAGDGGSWCLANDQGVEPEPVAAPLKPRARPRKKRTT